MVEKYIPNAPKKETEEKNRVGFSLNKILITLALSGLIAGALNKEEVRKQIPGHALLEDLGSKINNVFNTIKDLISKGDLNDPKIEKEVEEIKKGGQVEGDGVKIDFDNMGKVKGLEIDILIEDERSADLQKKLSYISNYFKRTDLELQILNSNPSSKVVCEFSDFLMRIEENKRSLEKVWDYISANFEKLPVNLKNNIGSLLTQASVLNPVTIDSVKNTLAQQTEKGTICGFKFNLAFNFLSKEKVSTFQKLSKEIISDLARHLKEKTERGNVDERESAVNAAVELSNLIFKKIKIPN